MPQGPFLLKAAIAAASAPIQKSARHNGLVVLVVRKHSVKKHGIKKAFVQTKSK